MIFFILNFVQCIPFVAYYMIDEPHDCFVCLGKDPDRIYSSI